MSKGRELSDYLQRTIKRHISEEEKPETRKTDVNSWQDASIAGHGYGGDRLASARPKDHKK
jgi:hypothetical protein